MEDIFEILSRYSTYNETREDARRSIIEGETASLSVFSDSGNGPVSVSGSTAEVRGMEASGNGDVDTDKDASEGEDDVS